MYRIYQSAEILSGFTCKGLLFRKKIRYDNGLFVVKRKKTSRANWKVNNGLWNDNFYIEL